MRDFRKEFTVPLNHVHRTWLRRFATILVSLIIILLSPLIGTIDTLTTWWNEFLIDCWKGVNDE